MLAVESVVHLFMSFERPEMLLEWRRSSSHVVLEHIYEYLSGWIEEPGLALWARRTLFCNWFPGAREGMVM